MLKGKWICLFLTLIISAASAALKASGPIGRELINKTIEFYHLDTGKVSLTVRRMTDIPKAPDYDNLSISAPAEIPSTGLLTEQITFYKGPAVVLQSRAQIKITRFEFVLVTAEDIRRNEIIGEEKCRLEKMDITGLMEEPLTRPSQLAGKWSKRFIRKGQILTSGVIEEIPTVMSGQTINILYKTPGLEITARGKALQAGYSGDNIKVQNIQSNKVISGTVVDTKTVSVESL
jgi:flagella basal body P-ring formation protein FlgA